MEVSELYVNEHLQLYQDIAASKYLRVRIVGGKIVFSTTHFVGHIPLNDRVALNVVPRFGVSNLTRLLRLARHSPLVLERYVRGYAATHEALPSIFDDLAAAFVNAMESVVKRGLFQSYQRRVEDASLARGRILVTPTISRHFARGNRTQVTTARFEHNLDNPANQLLKYTMWLVDRRFAATVQRKGIAQLRTRLNRFYRTFAAVTLDSTRRFFRERDALDINRLPPVRSYYAQAMQLALLLVQDDSLDLSKHDGRVRVPSMLVDLQAAFEAYLFNSMKASGVVFPDARLLNGNIGRPAGGKKRLFDDPESEDATPDMVVVRTVANGGERVLAVVEVKYKDSPDRTDVNQAIAYGVSYRCPIVVLAHVRQPGTAAGLTRIGSIGELTVFSFAFDLAGNLEAEELSLARTIASLIPLSSITPAPLDSA